MNGKAREWTSFPWFIPAGDISPLHYMEFIFHLKEIMK